MRHRLLCCILMLLPLSQVSAKATTASTPSQGEPLTATQAIEAVRAKAFERGSSFEIIREIPSTGRTRALAQRSLQQAGERHSGSDNSGILVDVMQYGGFLVLEKNPKSASAVGTHLVSKHADGRMVIDSHKIDSEISAALAAELLNKTSHLADELLSIAPSRATELETAFDKKRFPVFESSEEESFFAIPRAITRIKAEDREYAELAGLLGYFELWRFRYAFSMPVYLQDPSVAIRSAQVAQQAVVEQVRQTNNKNADFLSSSIANPAELRERISLLRRVDDLLDQKSASEAAPETADTIRGIATLPLQVESASSASKKENSYVVLTSAGLVVEWKQDGAGHLMVRKISLASY